ncbi:MAG: shikimate kinase [Acidimicrobiales bacterium]
MSKSDRLFLIGMMGVGKTTVGQLVAAKLGWEFLDSDAQLIFETTRTAPQIFAESGDEGLRELERHVLADAIDNRSSSVIAVAGGVVLSDTSRSLLVASGEVAWLRATVATMAMRVGTGEGRPRLGANPEEAIRRLYEVRRPLYELIADVVIDVDELSPEAVRDRVIGASGLSDRVTKYEN